jgi:hypothetical protein
MQIADPVLVSAIVRRAVYECIASSQSPDLKSPSQWLNHAPEEIFYSPTAQAIKEEIILTGTKLWDRKYMDGNGRAAIAASVECVSLTPRSSDEWEEAYGRFTTIYAAAQT